MADESCLESELVSIDFDDDLSLDEALSAVDLSDDLDDGEIVMSDFVDEDVDLSIESMTSIPLVTVTFVSEDQLQVATHDPSLLKKGGCEKDAPISDKISKKCLRCGKIYKTLSFFLKHTEHCTVNPSVGTKKLGKVKLKEKQKVFDSTTLSSESTYVWLCNAFSDAKIDPFFSLGRPGRKVVEIASAVLNVAEGKKELFVAFGSYLSNLLLPLLLIDSTMQGKREQMMCTLYSISVSESNCQKFSNFLNSLQLEAVEEGTIDLIWPFILDKFFTSYLKHRNDVVANHDRPKSLCYSISAEEEQSIKYVAGYIIHSLRRKYCKLKNSPARDAIIQLLTIWAGGTSDEGQHNSILEYTSVWIKKVSHGKLINVTDSFYLFIRSVEVVVRSMLNIQTMHNYRDQDLRDVISEKLSCSTAVDRAWSTLVRNVSSDGICEILKPVIITRWVNIRAYAFVKNWLEIMKKKKDGDVSEKAEPSLRKGLFSKPGTSGHKKK